MKYLVKIFVVTFFYLICTHAFAQQNIVYLDMKYILNNSKAGKGAQDYLKKTFQDNQKKFTSQENNLKKEESDLLAKKNELSKEDYQKKTDSLRKKVIDYQSKRRSSLDKITAQRAKAREDLIKALDPIIQKYISENGITMVIDKKNIVMANTSLDITNTIIEKLNKELPSLNLN